MPQPTCHHIHANGALCKSPPVRNRDYCHFHLDQIGRQLRAARARARHLPAMLKLPLLEDPFAIHAAITQIGDAILHNEIDVPRGRLLMSVLRLASRNLKMMREWQQEPLFAAEGNAETAITEWPTFEQENQLPPDFDLSVDPEVAFPAPQENPAAGAGMGGRNADPLKPTAGLSGAPASEAPEYALRARIQQALGEAETPAPLVTADTVELMDLYDREGEEVARKFADRLVRNDHRRERRRQRAHYEALARNHTIRLAAKKLLEDQLQREALEAASNPQPASSEPDAIGGPVEVGDGLRKKPASEAAAREFEAGSGTA